LLNRTGQQGNVYQAHQLGKWNPRSSAYGRFWIDVPSGERKRSTVSLGLCATQWEARRRLREYIERAGVRSKYSFHEIPVPGTTLRKQAEWWMESLSTRRRRPLKPATIYGWQHCLDRWILPNPEMIGAGIVCRAVRSLSIPATSHFKKSSCQDPAVTAQYDGFPEPRFWIASRLPTIREDRLRAPAVYEATPDFRLPRSLL
jgi:hypothetical protein